MKFPSVVLLALFAQLPLAGATIVVLNLSDSGAGSLRDAIASATNGDTIAFGVSGTISLASPLSVLTDLTILGSGIVIDGNATTIFDLNGAIDDSFSDITLTNSDDAINGADGAFVSLLGATISDSTNALSNMNATVTNSTFAGNGDGIKGGTVSLYDSTISGGTNGTENTNLTIGNSIIDGNTLDVGSGTVVTDLGHNLVGTGSGFSNGVNGDIVGTSAQLGSLANNGGPTQTYALLTGSPAIDAGDNTLIPNGVTTDQRGPGYGRISGTAVDIGAYEVQQIPEPATYLTCLLGIAFGAIRLRKRTQR